MRRHCATIATIATIARGVLVLSFVLAVADASAPAQDSSPESEVAVLEPPDDLSRARAALAPGLLVDLRARGADGREAALTRIDPKPAFSLGRGSPHPRLPPGPFAATWTGILEAGEDDTVRFGAFVGGELEIAIDGLVVLRGRGEHDAAWVDALRSVRLRRGLHRLRIDYRGIANVGARLQLWWEGTRFLREPVPAWRLRHLPSELPATAALDAQAAAGREAAGRYGCARCHRGAFPSVEDPAPGPSLADVGQRVTRSWLMDWLASPRSMRSRARMPELFPADRRGFVERWLVADALFGVTGGGASPERAASGDQRTGRQWFLGLGCIACHFLPDVERASQPELDWWTIDQLADRMTQEQLARFLVHPATRYPDGRMPAIPVTLDRARAIASWLLATATPALPDRPLAEPPTDKEMDEAAGRLRVSRGEAGLALLREKGCVRCHPGLPEAEFADRGIAHPETLAADPRGCIGGTTTPRFDLEPATRRELTAFLAVAGGEIHASPADERRRLLARLGCVRCHRRDSDRPSPLDEIGTTLWTPLLYRLPFQKTPSLTNPLAKYTPEYLADAIREGVSGVRPSWYSYEMPAFGALAGEIVQALAEADGDLPDCAPDPARGPDDPTLATVGPELVGFDGYSCVSCHLWNGTNLSVVDPAAVGPELTTVPRRIRRDWFDRWLADPGRVHPGTAMPSFFRKGEPASVTTLLAGDPARQKEAIWSYLKLGRDAPAPRPRPPIAIRPPQGVGPLVAAIPVHVESTGEATPGSRGPIEAVCIFFESDDLLLFDAAAATLRNVYADAQILRSPNGGRSYRVTGTALLPERGDAPAFVLAGEGREEAPRGVRLQAYDLLSDGARIRSVLEFEACTIEVSESLRLVRDGGGRSLVRELAFEGVPDGCAIESRGGLASEAGRLPLPPRPAPSSDLSPSPEVTRPRASDVDTAYTEGELVRPGYRAIRYPRPQTASGEDLVMPGAIAVDPISGRVFVASMKLGEIFEAVDPDTTGRVARFEDWGRGLFQEAFALQHDGQALEVLHRRSITRITDTDKDGKADRFERIAAIQHAIGDAYDWGYGLARDRTGAYLLTLAPYGDPKLPGAGSIFRLTPDRDGGRTASHGEEIAFGLRNAFGWCNDVGGEAFFTDNQGEWVATNKLCHVDEGRFYGWRNHGRPEQHELAPENACIWIPYGWAKSVNGLACDTTGGRFGPFAGQLFIAELMHGGALLRANVEQVHGTWQGACFPFWGKGLLGPLCLAFDPKGPLYVGSITMPGWMGQPDRGAFHRIEFTGEVLFEIQSIHARPDGFRLVFTQPVDPTFALDPASYRVERYHYEYTGAYGSPELDRTQVAVTALRLAGGAREVLLSMDDLARGWVYAISAAGVRSTKGESPVYATGAYTLNEIPGE